MSIYVPVSVYLIVSVGVYMAVYADVFVYVAGDMAGEMDVDVSLTCLWVVQPPHTQCLVNV